MGVCVWAVESARPPRLQCGGSDESNAATCLAHLGMSNAPQTHAFTHSIPRANRNRCRLRHVHKSTYDSYRAHTHGGEHNWMWRTTGRSQNDSVTLTELQHRLWNADKTADFIHHGLLRFICRGLVKKLMISSFNKTSAVQHKVQHFSISETFQRCKWELSPSLSACFVFQTKQSCVFLFADITRDKSPVV